MLEELSRKLTRGAIGDETCIIHEEGCSGGLKPEGQVKQPWIKMRYGNLEGSSSCEVILTGQRFNQGLIGPGTAAVTAQGTVMNMTAERLL